MVWRKDFRNANVCFGSPTEVCDSRLSVALWSPLSEVDST